MKDVGGEKTALENRQIEKMLESMEKMKDVERRLSVKEFKKK